MNCNPPLLFKEKTKQIICICTEVISVQRAHILGTDSIVLSQEHSPPSQSSGEDPHFYAKLTAVLIVFLRVSLYDMLHSILSQDMHYIVSTACQSSLAF